MVTLTEEDCSRFASRHGFVMPSPTRRTGSARMSLSSGVHLCSVIAGMSTLDMATLEVKFFFWWPFGDQLFRFSRQGIFLGGKIYVNNKVLIIG